MFWVIARGEAFWSRHPALFVGVCFFLGASFRSFSVYDALFLPFLFHHRRFFLSLLLIFVAAFTTSFRVCIPTHPLHCFGTVRAEVMDRRLMTLHGKPFWRLQLALDEFRSSEGKVLIRGCSVPLSCASPCPLRGGALYQFSAHAVVDDQVRVRLRPSLAAGIEVLGPKLSFVEWRHSMRQLLEQRFVKLFPDPSLRYTAGALTFGLYKDPLFQKAMHRTGVEHVLAVSGFHFGIVAALTVFLARGLSRRRRAIVAMVFLTLYLLLIGPLPSVVRAWTAAMAALGGICLCRLPSGLNCLGLGLIASVIYDPSSVSGIGYHLSYLATAAILFFSQPTLALLRRLVPSRSIPDALVLSKSDQLLLFLIESFLPALSLLIPVFFVVCPYQLTFLQDFSLLGLIYNLLIPALFSLAMPAVLLAVLLWPLPFVPSLFASIASIPLSLGRLLVERAPETAWGMAAGGGIPRAAGLALLLFVLLAGIFTQGCADENRGDAWKSCL